MLNAKYEERHSIRAAACKLAGWNQCDTAFSASGQRNGRPVWEIINMKTCECYMFSAFDADDIYDIYGKVAGVLTPIPRKAKAV